uniref:Uncharacterized protein n=1 Tax=Calcidiscus leptoporus TaxID=127549 RepID=A0A7S0IUH9_9EUKA|mmetsp:Transcript_23561/g.54527  ORF Transcript_23561/g.54527 Transcript_23561/m.54527 type:complete len:176 (+) Transcript_23561:478-1005(+)
MLLCSATFNVGQRRWRAHTAFLALLDHIGICMLIAGSHSPVYARACCLRSLGVLWLLMLLTITAKAAGGHGDNIVVHVISFVFGPVVLALLNLQAITAAHAAEALDVRLMYAAGLFYIGGLAPWSIRALEGHVAVWHFCVLMGSACIFALNYRLVAHGGAAAVELQLEQCVGWRS